MRVELLRFALVEGEHVGLAALGTEGRSVAPDQVHEAHAAHRLTAAADEDPITFLVESLTGLVGRPPLAPKSHGFTSPVGGRYFCLCVIFLLPVTSVMVQIDYFVNWGTGSIGPCRA